MTDRTPPPGSMPEPGTTEPCWFCRRQVTLGNDGGKSGWFYWAATGELADGVRRCDGGRPAENEHDSTLLTLHLPQGRAWMYDPAGSARTPRGLPYEPRRTA